MPTLSSGSNVYTFKQTVLKTEEEIKEYEKKKAKKMKNKINNELYSKNSVTRIQDNTGNVICHQHSEIV